MGVSLKCSLSGVHSLQCCMIVSPVSVLYGGGGGGGGGMHMPR